MRRVSGGAGIIPQLVAGEMEEDLRVHEWEKMREGQIVSGRSKTVGGGGLQSP